MPLLSRKLKIVKQSGEEIRLEVVPGSVDSSEIQQELGSISTKHNLPTAGGGLVSVMIVGGSSRLGGMNVPASKWGAVRKELTERGYQIIGQEE